jgi:hypothetical protein
MERNVPVSIAELRYIRSTFSSSNTEIANKLRLYFVKYGFDTTALH